MRDPARMEVHAMEIQAAAESQVLAGAPVIEPLLLSKSATAQALSVSLRTIGNLIADKQLPHKKIGKRTLIPTDAVKRFARCAVNRKK